MPPNEFTRLVAPKLLVDTYSAPATQTSTKVNDIVDMSPTMAATSHEKFKEETGLLHISDGQTPGISRENSIQSEAEPIQVVEIEQLERVDSSVADSEPGEASFRQKLGMWPLAVLVFYNVSGGPFGIEPTVQAGGNFYALLGFLVFPLIWSVQEALITAELGTAFPDAAGGVAWVEEAFGPKVGWMSGYLGWIAGATDNAIYPVLFLDYLLSALHDGEEDISPIYRFIFLSLTTLSLAYINFRGLALVGDLATWICLISMTPFLILVIMGIPKVSPERWFLTQVDEVQEVLDEIGSDAAGGFFPEAVIGGVVLRPYLNNLFWNLNSFDAAASFVPEMESPDRVFPRSMLLGVLLVVVGYFFPLLVAIGATDYSRTDWTDGFLAQVAADIGGSWLGAATVFAAAISNIALFQAELSADAYQLMGMADRGHLPKVFSKRSRYGTPINGIILGVIVIVVMGLANFDELIEMLNFNYSISLLMEYCAFLKLRISQPDVVRPYKIPFGTFGCAIVLAPAMLATVLILCIATYKTYIFTICANLVGFVMYSFMFRGRGQASHQAIPTEVPNAEIT